MYWVSGSGNTFILTNRSVDVIQTCSEHEVDGVLQVEGNRMMIFNADGSRASMCGNGLRCVMRYLAHDGDVMVETDAGPYRGKVIGDEVEVLMKGVHLVREGVVWSGVEHQVIEGEGSAIEGRNVNYVKDGLVRTFERGVGETRSCGTGATAVAFLYGLNRVEFVSGEVLHFRHTDEGIWMRGTVVLKPLDKL